MADGLSTSPNKETVTLRLPSGEMVDALVPAGFSDADLKSYVRMKRPDLFGAPAGVQKPQVNMQTGEGPVAQGMTSFETQLSNLPRNLWQGSFFGEIGNPKVRALHEQRQQQEKQAMAQPGLLPGAKYAGSLINPVAKVDAGTPAERIDVGATGANLLPYAVAARSALNDVPIGRVAKAGGAAIKGGILNTPVVGRIARGAIRGATKSWEASAPTTEIPPSKVSTTAPEASPTVSLNRLTSDIQSLGYSKADALARAKAGIAKYPNDLNAATTEAMRPSRAQTAAAPTSTPSSKPAQVAQVRAVQAAPTNAPPAAPIQQPKATSAPTQYEVAPPSRPLRVEGKDVPANTELTSALQKSISQTKARTTGKQVYHVAPESGLENIRKNGLTIPENGEGMTKRVYAFTNKTDARDYAESMTKSPGNLTGEKYHVITAPAEHFPEGGFQAGHVTTTDPVPANKLGIPEASQSKVLSSSRIQGKIMQVVRREGTLDMDRLMKAPELQGLSREQVEAAAMELGKSEKLWVPTKEADAHGPAGIDYLAIRKR